MTSGHSEFWNCVESEAYKQGAIIQFLAGAGGPGQPARFRSLVCAVTNGHYENRWFRGIQLGRTGSAGDLNSDGDVTVTDVMFAVNYLFKTGPPPEPCAPAGDLNLDGLNNSADIVSLVRYVLKGRALPVR